MFLFGNCPPPPGPVIRPRYFLYAVESALPRSHPPPGGRPPALYQGSVKGKNFAGERRCSPDNSARPVFESLRDSTRSIEIASIRGYSAECTCRPVHPRALPPRAVLIIQIGAVRRGRGRSEGRAGTFIPAARETRGSPCETRLRLRGAGKGSPIAFVIVTAR